MAQTRHRLTALASAALLALGGAGIAACGDDKEGPGEDVGEAVDKAGKKAGKELEEAKKDLDDGKRD